MSKNQEVQTRAMPQPGPHYGSVSPPGTSENSAKETQSGNPEKRKEPSDGYSDIDLSDKAEKMAKNLSESKTGLVELKKDLGLMDGVGIIVGIIIGAGIFVSPGSVVRYTGSVGMSLMVWVASGLVCMIGAYCYCEMGTMIPKSGGSYVYILEAYGQVPAFLALWVVVFVQSPGNRAIVLITFANYLLQPFFPNCSTTPYLAVRFVALCLLAITAYINCKGLRMGARLQDFLTLTKVFALIVIIVAGMYHLARGHTENYQNPMEGTNYDPSSIATAFFSTLYAYSGWNVLNSVMDELQDPHKTLPRAIAISMTIVTIIYILTNVAYFAVLTPYEVMSSSAVAVTFGDRTLGVLAWIISIFVACSTFGNTNGSLITGSRLVFAGARAGHLPRCLKLINVNNNVPMVGIISIVILPSFMLFLPDIGSILAYTSFSGGIVSLMSISSLLWLRYKDPDRPRPIKVWIGFPIIYLIVTICLTVFPIVRRPVEIGIAVAVYMIGLLTYYLTIHLEIKALERAMDKLMYFCQLLFNCVVEETESLEEKKE